VTATHAFVPLLRRSPNARIVNMSSGLGSVNLLSNPELYLVKQGLLAYSSSKAALNALTLVYAEALRATLPADGPTGVFRGPGSLDVAPW